jgi:hypothetical protein
VRNGKSEEVECKGKGRGSNYSQPADDPTSKWPMRRHSQSSLHCSSQPDLHQSSRKIYVLHNGVDHRVRLIFETFLIIIGSPCMKEKSSPREEGEEDGVAGAGFELTISSA